MNIAGIIPAAGKATRMGGLPKFLLPVPEGNLLTLMCQRMSDARAERIDVATTQDFYILACRNLPDEKCQAGIYNDSPNLACTLLAMRNQHFYKDQVVIFGMPDSYWTDSKVFPELLGAIEQGADLAVGVWWTWPGQRRNLGMCRLHNPQAVIDKPAQTDLEWAWGALAWRPAFWEFIKPDMTTISDAINAAIVAGLKVAFVCMEGEYTDCGTPASYFKLISKCAGSE